MLCTVRLSRQESSVSLQSYSAEDALKPLSGLRFKDLANFIFLFILSIWSTSAFFFLCIENFHITHSRFETLFSPFCFQIPLVGHFQLPPTDATTSRSTVSPSHNVELCPSALCFSILTQRDPRSSWTQHRRQWSARLASAMPSPSATGPLLFMNKSGLRWVNYTSLFAMGAAGNECWGVPGFGACQQIFSPSLKSTVVRSWP